MGGLIIGQAAVSAGIVSPIMIVIVSVTAITSFIAPNYEVTAAFRIFRFAIIIASSFIGLYGIVIGIILLITHLVRLRSFGVAYLSPIVEMKGSDQKDMFFRFPFNLFKERPEYINPGDKIRQK